MKILVTGGAGLLGQAVVWELLERGHEVGLLDVRPLDVAWSPRVTTHCGDIADRAVLDKAIQHCDVIIHLAALPSPFFPSDEIFRVNVLGTRQVLAAAQAHNVNKVVLASSLAVYGMTFAPEPILPAYLPVDENHLLLAQDAYGLSKVENERDAAKLTSDTGITTICLRLAMVIDFAKIWRWLPFFSAKRPSHSLWGYIEVRDAARAFALVSEAVTNGNLTAQIVARDVFCRTPPHFLIERHFSPLVPYLAVYDSEKMGFWCSRRAETEFGFVAQNFWGSVPDMHPYHVWRWKKHLQTQRMKRQIMNCFRRCSPLHFSALLLLIF